MVEGLDMGPRRDLGHDAAIGSVLGDLAQDLVRQDRAASVIGEPDDRGGGFVAGGFEAEHAHAVCKSGIVAARRLERLRSVVARGTLWGPDSRSNALFRTCLRRLS